LHDSKVAHHVSDRAEREREMVKAMERRPLSSGLRKSAELIDDGDFLKMEYLKQQAFPSTTNQEFINIE
jgi:hypothetical protein